MLTILLDDEWLWFLDQLFCPGAGVHYFITVWVFSLLFEGFGEVGASEETGQVCHFALFFLSGSNHAYNTIVILFAKLFYLLFPFVKFLVIYLSSIAVDLSYATDLPRLIVGLFFFCLITGSSENPGYISGYF